MTQLALLHTSPAHCSTFNAIGVAMGKDISSSHVVDESLLTRCIQAGRVTEEVEGDLREIVANIRDNGASTILCTCTTIGDIAERCGKEVGIPTIRVDRAMIEAALNVGPKLLVAACIQSTLEPTGSLIEQCANELGKTPMTEMLLLSDAWAFFEAGDLDRYSRAIADGIREGLAGHDAVVLAQASMRPAETHLKDCGVPVFSSPELGLKKAFELAGVETE